MSARRMRNHCDDTATDKAVQPHQTGRDVIHGVVNAASRPQGVIDGHDGKVGEHQCHIGVHPLVTKAPCAAMTRATLHHLHISLRQQFKHFCCLLTHILGSGMTSNMQGDTAGDRFKSWCQTLFFRNIDDIFAQIKSGF